MSETTKAIRGTHLIFVTKDNTLIIKKTEEPKLELDSLTPNFTAVQNSNCNIKELINEIESTENSKNYEIKKTNINLLLCKKLSIIARKPLMIKGILTDDGYTIFEEFEYAQNINELNNLEPYKKFTQNNEVDKNTYLYRYISVNRLLDIIKNKKIIFPHTDKMSDKLELMTLKDIEVIQDNLEKNKEYKLKDAHNPSTNDKTDYQTYLSCWYLGEQNYENMQMWQNYATKDGVLIKIKFEDLNDILCKGINSFYKKNQDKEFTSYQGFVLYHNLRNKDEDKHKAAEEIQNIIGFNKDIAYKDENEYRFLIREKSDNKRDIITLDFDPNKIEEIITHPAMEDRKYEGLKAKLQTDFSKKLKQSFYTGFVG